MTKEPVMTLPSGDIIRDGDYAITRDGQKVGPINIPPKWQTWRTEVCADAQGVDGAEAWFSGGRYHNTLTHGTDLIAKCPAEAEAVKPNYNNGNWWGWSGGECPVHPESVVEYIWHDTNQNRFGSMQMKAGYNENDERPAWPHIIRFRVITPYVEPAPAVEPTPAAPPKPAKRDLRTINEPFGELDERTKKRLRKAAKRGWPIQYHRYGDIWGSEGPSWCRNLIYRLDPTFTPPPKRRVWLF
jgi:hypothetical protein